MQAAFALWIFGCAYLCSAGWILSALHELNRSGYAVALLIGLAALFVWRKKIPGINPRPVCRPKLRRRFRRPLPAIFLLAAVLIFLGMRRTITTP